MTWTDADSDGEAYLRLLKIESGRRSEMSAREGQQAARERIERIWAKALAGRGKQIKPLKWKAGGQ